MKITILAICYANLNIWIHFVKQEVLHMFFMKYFSMSCVTHNISKRMENTKRPKTRTIDIMVAGLHLYFFLKFYFLKNTSQGKQKEKVLPGGLKFTDCKGLCLGINALLSYNKIV